MMNTLWQARNDIAHKTTPEEIEGNHRRVLNPLIREAYQNREKIVSLFHLRLFKVHLDRRLSMSTRENSRWLEIVRHAQDQKRLREEAVIAATRKMTEFYTVRKHRSSKTKSETVRRVKRRQTNLRGALERDGDMKRANREETQKGEDYPDGDIYKYTYRNGDIITTVMLSLCRGGCTGQNNANKAFGGAGFHERFLPGVLAG